MRFFEAIHGVYFDDLDAFQILHNARYLLLFERTIGAFWGRLGFHGPLRADGDPDQWHLVRENRIEYLRPVEGTGEVRVRIWVEKLGRTSLIFGFHVLPMDEDRPYASGSRVLVRIDRATRQPCPWSDDLRCRLAPYVASASGELSAQG